MMQLIEIKHEAFDEVTVKYEPSDINIMASLKTQYNTVLFEMRNIAMMTKSK